MNYELIYKVRKNNFKTDSRSNLRAQFENTARAEANKLHEQYLAFLQKEIGHNRFEVTNISCMSDGITGHVYVWDKEPIIRGLGKGKCLFCGCDDFDD